MIVHLCALAQVFGVAADILTCYAEGLSDPGLVTAGLAIMNEFIDREIVKAKDRGGDNLDAKLLPEFKMPLVHAKLQSAVGMIVAANSPNLGPQARLALEQSQSVEGKEEARKMTNELFAWADKDGDGNLSQQEFAMLAATTQGETVSPAQFAALAKAFDFDPKDGCGPEVLLKLFESDPDGLAKTYARFTVIAAAEESARSHARGLELIQQSMGKY